MLFFFLFLFKISMGWVLFLVFNQRKTTSFSVRAGVLKEKEPYYLMKKKSRNVQSDAYRK